MTFVERGGDNGCGGNGLIEARDLSKVFKHRKRGAVHAVSQVSFQCQPGQIYALLGANGAGKTTTLRMLATILKPTAGTATVAGYDILKDSAAVRRNVGFLSTATALYGRLSAREMVEYFGRLNGLKSNALRQRTDELFDLLEIRAFASRRCDKLSTGMKQKVSIARTLVHDPAVMILDEPTIGLDVIAARTIVHFIRDCRERGKTVLFSTHVMSEVEKLADRVGIIHDGRIRAEGTLDELRERSGERDLEEIFVKTLGVEA